MRCLSKQSILYTKPSSVAKSGKVRGYGVLSIACVIVIRQKKSKTFRVDFFVNGDLSKVALSHRV